MYDSIDLSKYVVSKCTRDGNPIHNLQLQRILYFIQRAFLKKGKLAFADDIEVWEFGPVIPRSYYKFCYFGIMPIFLLPKDHIIELEDTEDEILINRIVEEKSVLRPCDLIAETRKPKGAWSKTYKDGQGIRCVISPKLIKRFG